MKFSGMMTEGNLDGIKEAATKVMDNKIKEVLFEKIDDSKQIIGRRIASQAVRGR